MLQDTHPAINWDRGLQRVFALCDEEDFLALPQSAAEREEESGNWNKGMWRWKPGLGDRRQGRREKRKEVKQA